MRTHYLFLLIAALLLTAFSGQPITAAANLCIWEGDDNSDWHNFKNWDSCNLDTPQSDDDVLIPADRPGIYDPRLSEDTTIRSLTNHRTLLSASSSHMPTLTVTGPELVNSGTIYIATAMRGQSPQQVSGGGRWGRDVSMGADRSGYLIIGAGSVVTLAGTIILSGSSSLNNYQPGLQIEQGATLRITEPQSMSLSGSLINNGTISGAGPLHLGSISNNNVNVKVTRSGRIAVPLVVNAGSIQFLEDATLEGSVTLNRNASLHVCGDQTLTVNGSLINNGGMLYGRCYDDTPEMQGTLVLRGTELSHNGHSISKLRLVFAGSEPQTLTSSGMYQERSALVISDGARLRLTTPLSYGGSGESLVLIEGGAILDIGTHRVTAPNYVQQPGATLRIGLTGNGDELQYGSLRGSMSTTLSGTLEVYLADDQMPDIPDPVGMIRHNPNARSGAFDHVVVLPELDLVPVYTTGGIDMTPVDQSPGRITGRVIDMEGTGLTDIRVQAYRQRGTAWSAMAAATTTTDGMYRLENLPGGNYRVRFHDPQGTYRPEYYADTNTLATADTLTVNGNQETPDIDASLDLPATPLAQVDTTRGSVTSDPNDGTVTVAFPRNRREDTTISSSASCPGNTQPSGVTLWVGERSYPMTVSSADSGIYQATLPESEVTTGALLVRWDCDGTTQEQTIGRIVLYDPSGVITDAQTGQPVVGATVTLHRVPGALPDTRDEQRDCRTIATRQGDSWAGEPAATPGLGLAVNPELAAINGTAEISPTLNPQITNDVGRYGWDVAEGCWYITVVADGYEPTSSPVVGVPEPVTDLDLRLTPTNRTVYLPLVIR
jgi:5-hydroxyisourate hydrolase-like protein (transthyretin family)